MPPHPEQLAAFARDLADEAGARLLEAVHEPRMVRWKTDVRRNQRSAVSDLDEAIEQRLRERIRLTYPSHAVIGEELVDTSAAMRDRSPYTWVLDPIDGTANFTNRVPLYAVAIGVLDGAVPIAGAIWCASSSLLRPTTYHAWLDSPLFADDARVERWSSHAVRGIVSEPGSAPVLGVTGDTRVLGSAATECAWVAAGMLRAARLTRPRLWDVAAGVVLARAADCVICTTAESETRWQPFIDFADGMSRVSPEALREWSRPLLMAQVGTEFAPALEVCTRP